MRKHRNYFIFRAGEGIRTLDFNLGKVATTKQLKFIQLRKQVLEYLN